MADDDARRRRDAAAQQSKHRSLLRTARAGVFFNGTAREITDPAERDTARSIICASVYPIAYAEAALHLHGLPSRAKIKELHRYWFDTGHPITIDLAVD